MPVYEIPLEFKASYIECVYVRADSPEEALAWLKENRKPIDLINGFDSLSVSNQIFDDFHEIDEFEVFPEQDITEVPDDLYDAMNDEPITEEESK